MLYATGVGSDSSWRWCSWISFSLQARQGNTSKTGYNSSTPSACLLLSHQYLLHLALIPCWVFHLCVTHYA